MPYRANNYSLVADTSFNPFQSMSEMLVPFMAYKEAYEKDEAAISDLEQKASIWEGMANEETDPIAYKQYKKYADDLRQAAISLTTEGRDPDRRRFLDLKRRYNAEILPIEDAYKRRRAQAEEQQKAYNANPTLRFSRMAATTSLDKYLRNPELGYESFNGALLAQQTSTAASALAKQLREGIRTGRLDGFTKTWIEDRGFDAKDVLQAIENPHSPNSSPILRAIVDDAVTTSGVQKWGDADLVGEAYKWAGSGLWSAVGNSQIHTYSDEASKLAAQEESRLRVLEHAARLKAGGQGSSASGGGAGSTNAVIKPSVINSAEEVDRQTKAIKDYQRYFTVDSRGRTVLNSEGVKEYNRKGEFLGSGAYAKTTDSAFKQFVDGLGGGDMMQKRQYGNIGNLWNQYKQSDPTKYDATALIEYDHSIDPSEYNNWKARISEKADGKLEKVRWDSKQKKWVTDDTVDVSEAFKDDGNPTSTQSSFYGRTFRVVDKKGNTTRYRLPRGINSRAEENIDIHLGLLNQIHELNTKLGKKDSMTISVEDARRLNNIFNTKSFREGMTINKATLQSASTYLENALATFESQLGLTNTNKPQEWGPIDFGGGYAPSVDSSLDDLEEE